MTNMFRKLKLAVDGTLDRKHLYRVAAEVVRDCARKLDAYFEERKGHFDNSYAAFYTYGKCYEFKNASVILRYYEDGQHLVEIAAFDRGQSCIYPPPEKWAGVHHAGHGPGYRIPIYDDRLLRSTIADVAEWCINFPRLEAEHEKDKLAKQAAQIAQEQADQKRKNDERRHL